MRDRVHSKAWRQPDNLITPRPISVRRGAHSITSRASVTALTRKDLDNQRAKFAIRQVTGVHGCGGQSRVVCVNVRSPYAAADLSRHAHIHQHAVLSTVGSHVNRPGYGLRTEVGL